MALYVCETQIIAVAINWSNHSRDCPYCPYYT